MPIKYFIEDAETNEWYKNTLPFLEPTVHTINKGWDKQPLMGGDYWTNNPTEALSFNEKETAEHVLEEIITSKPLRLEFTKDNDTGTGGILRIMIVTEHLFM